jgi:hypothetical protein
MPTKSDKPLYCRTCGKPIRKWTVTVYVRKEPSKYDHEAAWIRHAYVGDNWPKSKADCQKLTNQQILSVSYTPITKDGDVIGQRLSHFGEWDGESYIDQYFCSNTCAQNMGRAAAIKGWGTKQWEAQARKHR